MLNFDYQCPTRVVFGKGSIARLPELLDKSKKILMVYGGGSIKANGVYDQVKTALTGYNVTEFEGIEPNPKYETCMKAVEIVKKENIDFLLAVGGGSTLDATKFIAAASKFEGDEPYDILSKGAEVKDALSIGDVITLPATGSEMNGNSVISRISTGEKLAFASQKVYPTFSVIDPEVTYSLPKKQTINGIVDTFVHTMEQYCTYDVNTPLQDSWAFGLFKTLIEEAPKVLADPLNYEARANIFWCATCGLNFWLGLGCAQDWATHKIGHELTAFYGVDHGQSLAVVLPRLLKNQEKVKEGKLIKMGREVFGVQTADETIAKIEAFFNSIGMNSKLSDYGIDPEEAAEKIRARFEERGEKFGEHKAIDAEVSYDIIKAC